MKNLSKKEMVLILVPIVMGVLFVITVFLNHVLFDNQLITAWQAIGYEMIFFLPGFFATVRLFLNKNENSHIEFLDKATQLKDYMLYTSLDKVDFEHIRKTNAELVDLFQDILKDEWNRVKWGERKWKWKKD